MKKKEVKWPTLTVSFPCPDTAMAEILRYWDDILIPRKGEWCHPEDVKKNKKYRAAIKVLLEFCE